MILFVSFAHAADAWSVPARNAGLHEDAWSLDVHAGWQAGVVPVFRVAARDRLSLGLGGEVQLGRVGLGIHGDWLRDQTASGAVTSGFGDLHLGTTVEVVQTGPVAWVLGWEAKMPNASDTGELGTDETDVLFGLTGLGRFGPVGVTLAGGLAILGNPLRFANQDDVPMLRLGVAGTWGDFTAAGAGRWDFQTSRNPARGAGELSVRYGPRWFVELGGSAGWTPAEADWGATIAIGWRGMLPGRAPRG